MTTTQFIRSAFSALALSSVAYGAFAQTNATTVAGKEIAECAANTNTVLRLACYDALATKNGLAPATKPTTVTGSGEWRTSTQTDPLTDKSVHVATLIADSGRGRFGEAIGLTVRCANNKTELYINWNSYLGLESIFTTYRVDKDAAAKSTWTISTDHKAAFFPGSPVTVLKRLVTSQSFVANVTPYGENPVTATFKTAGAETALADIRKGCKW
ncbi:type VI secretion system-associated protein TagO [Pigmentiphaga aceris]|nr:type VI secretion system-associated protein TagO [Pigmentiphaga aceris]